MILENNEETSELLIDSSKLTLVVNSNNNYLDSEISSLQKAIDSTNEEIEKRKMDYKYIDYLENLK